MRTLIQDLRYGTRMLARYPGFVLLVVGLLSLGLGMTTAMFSLFDAVMLRPLAVRKPEELVRMVQQLPKIGTYSQFSYFYYRALRDHATKLAVVFGETRYSHFTLSDPEPAEAITVHGVTPEYFEALGVPALYGRVLLPSDGEDSQGTPPAVLSYGFWRRRFAGDPEVVNRRTVLVNGHRLVVVGVMPREFNGLLADATPDLRVPLRAWLLLEKLTPDDAYLELAGRLKPGLTRLQAEAECRTIWLAAETEYMQKVRKMPASTISDHLRIGMWLEPIDRGVSVVRDRYGDVFKFLMASVIVLILIVCANVGGLLLARTAPRQPEFAVRAAVGATRFQLIRQVSTENFLLAGLGAAGGLLICLAVTSLAGRMLPPMRDLSTSLVLLSLNLDFSGRVFLFLLALSLLTMLLFSLSPAIAVSRPNLDRLLRAARSSSGWRGRQALVTFQIALCTFLLVVASLFVRTFQHLQRVDPGFDRDHIATFTIDLSGHTGDASAFWKALTEQVRELPGVVSVGFCSIGVMRGRGLGSTVAPAGQRITRADFLNTSFNAVSLEYFDTMGIRILAGRGFMANHSPGPKQAGPVMAVVNQAFAERFFPNVSPLGKRFGQAENVEGIAAPRYEINGVVSDAKYRSVREPIVPTFYTLSPAVGGFVMNVRTRVRPQGIIEPTRKILASIDPTVPLREVHTLAEEVDNSMAGERITARLALLFGPMAGLLAGAGIYGLLAYVVTQRRHEIGIRMALGAQPVEIGKLIARQTLAMTAMGVALGTAGALIAGSAIRSLLYGISPQDPKSFVAAMIFIAMIVTVATVLPAMRATHVDPMVVLRYE